MRPTLRPKPHRIVVHSKHRTATRALTKGLLMRQEHLLALVLGHLLQIRSLLL